MVIGTAPTPFRTCCTVKDDLQVQLLYIEWGALQLNWLGTGLLTAFERQKGVFKDQRISRDRRKPHEVC
jgi:hypothetical protein